MGNQRRFSAIVSVVCLVSLFGAAVRGQVANGPYTPSASVIASVPEYDLSIRVEPASHFMEVKGTLRLPPANEARDSVRISLSDRYRDAQFEVVEPRESAGPVSLHVVEGNAGLFMWYLLPGVPFPAKKGVLLRLSYRGGEKEQPVGFALNPTGTYAIGSTGAWYPELIVPGVGNVRSVGRFRVTVPEDYMIAAAGRTGAPQVADNRRTEEFIMDRPAWFNLGVGHYTVIERHGPTPIRLFVLKDRAVTRAGLDRLDRVLDALVHEYGPFPAKEAMLIEAPSPDLWGAGGPDGAIMISSTMLDMPYEIALFAHELAHTWFGGVLATGNGEMSGEAMANVAALRVIELLNGPAHAARFRKTGVPGYQTFQNAFGYAKLRAAGYDIPLTKQPENGGQRNIYYGKGMLVLDLWARTVGRDRFNAALRRYMAKYPYDERPWDFFLNALAEDTGVPVKRFADEWIARTGLPTVRITGCRQDSSGVTANLEQGHQVYHFDIEIRAYGAAGLQATQTIRFGDSTARLKMAVRFKVDSLVVDPANLIPRLTDESMAVAEGVAPWTRWIFGGDTANVLSALRGKLLDVPTPDRYGVRFSVQHVIGRFRQSTGDLLGARDSYRDAVGEANRRNEELPWVYLRMADVADLLGGQELRTRSLEAAISADAIGLASDATLRAQALLHR